MWQNQQKFRAGETNLKNCAKYIDYQAEQILFIAMTRAWTARVRHAGEQTILGFHLTSEAYRVTMA